MTTRSPRAARAFLCLALPLLAACITRLFDRDPNPISDVDRTIAAQHLDLAREEIENGDLERALERLTAVRAVEGLLPETRYDSEELIDRCAELLLQRYSEPELDADALAELYEEELSPRMRARAGVRYARALLAGGSRITAYRQIKKVEQELPGHTERIDAGEILAEAGLSLARGGGRYNLLFSNRNRGIEALEYLVITYPTNPRCAEAYGTLAGIYEELQDYDLAIDRHEDLLLFHPDSPQAVYSEARLPYLRLKQLDRADYDRGEMALALREIQGWLARHRGHEIEGWMEEVEAACLSLLSENDLYLARYYDRIANPFGARMHAERALDEAARAENDDLAEEARTLLAALAPIAIEARDP